MLSLRIRWRGDSYYFVSYLKSALTFLQRICEYSTWFSDSPSRMVTFYLDNDCQSFKKWNIKQDSVFRVSFGMRNFTQILYKFRGYQEFSEFCNFLTTNPLHIPHPHERTGVLGEAITSLQWPTDITWKRPPPPPLGKGVDRGTGAFRLQTGGFGF